MCLPPSAFRHHRGFPSFCMDALFEQPIYVMAKPAGAMCNLRCEYCYYLEEHKGSRAPRKVGTSALMSDELLELFVKEYIEMQASSSVLFTWHGGEPLMRPLSFYKKAIALQKKYARGKTVDNCIQTNGTLITEQWARFFKDNGWLVGVSIDGPRETHDKFRRSRTGRPSHHQVLKGIDLLNRAGAEWNAMAVVNGETAKDAAGFYRFFKEIGAKYLQFTPVVERWEGKVMPWSVSPEAWGEFCCEVFDEWVRSDVGEWFVQLFDATLAGWVGATPGVCTMAETCGCATALETGGDLYACDHFVFPEWKLGNIFKTPLGVLAHSEKQRRFGESKRTGLTRECRECEFLFACHGECLRNRFALSSYGEPGHNYLCKGYKRFFRHVTPYMDFMKKCLQKGEAPAKVMDQKFHVAPKPEPPALGQKSAK